MRRWKKVIMINWIKIKFKVLVVSRMCVCVCVCVSDGRTETRRQKIFLSTSVATQSALPNEH